MGNLWATWMVAFGGMMAVNVLWMLISSWIRMLLEVSTSTGQKRSWSVVMASSLFHAGPWALIAAIAFGIYVRAAPWAPWFFGGAVVWVLFMVAIVSITMWRIKRIRKSNGV
jgi:hypothetical protein